MPNCENRTVKATDVVWLDDTGNDRPSPQTDRVLSLRNVSEMFVISQLTLRYYELRGLIRRGHVHDGVPASASAASSGEWLSSFRINPPLRRL